MNALTNISKTYKSHVFLLLAAVIWGLGTVFMKEVVSGVDPFWLASTRFFSAGVILSLVFSRNIMRLVREKKLLVHVKASLLVGVPMMIGYMLNAFGLVGTTASKSSFLTGLYCVIVPFVTWFLTKKRPTAFNLVAASMCVCGIAMVSVVGNSSFAISWGDTVTLLSAAFMAIQLALTSKVAPGKDMMSITALSFLLAGGASIGVAALISPLPEAASLMQPDMVSSIVYLVLFATCAALLLQNIGLAKVPAAQGSLLLSFESVFGVLFGVIILGEALTVPMIFGFILIFSSVVVSEWLPSSNLAKLARKRCLAFLSSRKNVAKKKNGAFVPFTRYNSKMIKIAQKER